MKPNNITPLPQDLQKLSFNELGKKMARKKYKPIKKTERK